MSRLRSLRWPALLTALALLAGACGGSSAGDEPGDAAATSTTAPAGAPTETTGAPTTAPGGQATADTLPAPVAPTPGDGESILPNEYGAPEPGRYGYEVGDDGDPALFEVYDTAGDQPDRTKDLRQIQIFVVESRADSRLISWEADGAYVEAEQAKQPDGSESALCRWSPRVLELPRPATVGAEWSFDSTCPLQDNYSRRIVGTARIVGTEQLQVAGATHEVVVIEREYDVQTRSDDGVLDVGQRYTVTDRWAPGLRLLARSEGTLASTVQGVARDPQVVKKVLVDPTPARR